MSGVARSWFFFLTYLTYLTLFVGPAQWLVLGPLVALWPSRRRAVVGAWLRLQARTTLALARVLGGLRVAVEGSLPPVSAIVLMNHQSVLDIPLGLSLVTGPYPLIPTRAKYGRGIPGVSGLVQLARFPQLMQGERASRQEFAAMTEAARQVARGEQSLLMFPEGHRSRDGSILPFMSSGLRLVFRNAPERPVYLLIVDGLWQLRTSAETARRLAGTTARVRIVGPYTIPPDPGEWNVFADSLRRNMIQVLEQLRTPVVATPEVATGSHAAV